MVLHAVEQEFLVPYAVKFKKKPKPIFNLQRALFFACVPLPTPSLHWLVPRSVGLSQQNPQREAVQGLGPSKGFTALAGEMDAATTAGTEWQ